MIFVGFLAIIAAFVIVALVGAALWWVLWAAVTGLVIGGLARLIIPGTQPIGILATVLCGWGGALIGGGIGHGVGLGHFFTVLVEIGVAAVAVGGWSARTRRRPQVTGKRHHSVIDV